MTAKARNRRAAHRVKDMTKRRTRPVLLAEDDDLRCTERSRFARVAGTHGRNDAGAETSCGEQAKAADCAGSACDQNRLIPPGPDAFLDDLYAREPRTRNRRCNLQIEARGYFRGCVRCNRDELRVSTLGHRVEQCSDPVARCKIHRSGADFDDRTGDIVAQNVRKTDRRTGAEQARAPFQVRRVHRGCTNADQDLTGARGRRLNVAHPQHFWCAVLVKYDRPHLERQYEGAALDGQRTLIRRIIAIARGDSGERIRGRRFGRHLYVVERTAPLDHAFTRGDRPFAAAPFEPIQVAAAVK